MGAGTGAPELGVTGVDLTSKFPRGERGEMLLRLEREQAEYHWKQTTCPQSNLCGQHHNTKDDLAGA